MSYKGQLLQDQWVAETLEFKRGGYFLDIGAFDGVQISNTYYLEKELEWDGICVEAGFSNYGECRKNRKCLCLNYAVGDTDGGVKFNENWTMGKVGSGLDMEGITFYSLFKKYKVPKHIDYISLDIEGNEYNALKCFPFKKYSVTLWSIEHNAHDDNGVMRDQIRELMTVNGYRIARELAFEDWFCNINMQDDNK